MVTLLAFGSNGSGQLGIGDRDDTCIPQRCQFHGSPPKSTDHIKQIAAGGNHTLILFESGDLYAAGSNANGRAGIPSSIESTQEFHHVQVLPDGTRAKCCSATWEASVVVTHGNEVYSFGNGPRGELGAGDGVSSGLHRLDHFCPPNTEIIDLASGVEHTVAILSNGEAYGWGNGRKGQLGEPNQVLWNPRKVENLDFNPVKAACGREFTYLAGASISGYHSVLGSDKWKVKSDAPPSMPRWKSLGATWGSILVVDEYNKITAWGRNDRGQLGPERTLENGLIESLALGSEHVLALSKTGTVGAWGWGEHGNCGTGIDADGDVKGWFNTTLSARFNGGARVIGIAAGCATSFAWTE
ncbi:MAG: hypothetical protein Q9190_007499 [Brigantiaea leucoxantha]